MNEFKELYSRMYIDWVWSDDFWAPRVFADFFEAQLEAKPNLLEFLYD